MKMHQNKQNLTKMLFLLAFFVLPLLTAAETGTAAVDVPYFVDATFADNFLAVTIGFDTTNHTDVSVAFVNAPACTFAAAGRNLFALNATWHACFPTPIDAGGSVANTINVTSVWHTPIGALPTLYTLLLTLHFETVLLVTSSITVLAADKASVTVFQQAAARPSSTPASAGSAGRSNDSIGGAVGGGVVCGVVVAMVVAGYWRMRRRQIVLPADA